MEHLYCVNISIVSSVECNVSVIDSHFQGPFSSIPLECSRNQAKGMDSLGCSIASTDFAAIDIFGAAQVTILNTQFEGNTGSYFGGAISIDFVKSLVSLLKFQYVIIIYTSNIFIFFSDAIWDILECC